MTKKRDSHEKQNDEVKKLTLFRKAFNFFLISKPIILDRHTYRRRKFGKKSKWFLIYENGEKICDIKERERVRTSKITSLKVKTRTSKV